LCVQQSIGLTVGYTGDRPYLAIEEISKLLPRRPINALVRAHPEVTAVVFQYLKYPVAEQPVFCPDACKSTVLKPDQAPVVGPEPENTLVVLMDRPDVIAGKSILLGVARHRAILEPDEPRQRAKPQISLAVLENVDYGAVV